MNKIKLILLLLIGTFTTLFTACDQDKGRSSVDFDYYYDAKEKNTVIFKAKGESDYGSFQFSWDFGDGSFGTGQNTAHSFEIGKYSVKLTADIPESNITTNKIKQIDIEPPQIDGLDFDIYYDPNRKDTVTFNAKGESSEGELNFIWDFGDGSKESGANVTHTFNEFKTFKVTLSAYVKGGKVAVKLSKDVALNSPEITNLDFKFHYDANDKKKIRLNASGDSSFGEIEYTWEFGDGFSGNGKSIEHTYNEFGTYNVKLIANIVNSKKTKDIEKIIILEEPNIDKLRIKAVQDQSNAKKYYLSAEGTSNFGNLVYSWDLGNNNTYEGTSRVTHIFDTFGYKNISLEAYSTEDSNVRKKINDIIEIRKPILSNVVISYQQDNKNPKLVRFSVNHDNIIGGNTKYEWKFSDGRISIDKEPTLLFTDFGASEIKLIITNELNGINETFKKSIELVEPKFENIVITSTEDSLNPLLYTFNVKTDSSSNRKIFYQWSFDDGSTMGGQTVAKDFNKYGKTNVCVTLTDDSNVREVKCEILDLKSPSIEKIEIVEIEKDFSNVSTVRIKANIELEEKIKHLEGDLDISWEFEDGQKLSGNVVKISRKMDPTNFAKENIKLTVSIPSIKLKEKYIFKDFQPKNLHFQIHKFSSVMANGKNKLDRIFKANTYLKVDPKPNKIFQHDANEEDLPSTEDTTPDKITDFLDIGKVSYEWDFGDGNTLITESPTIQHKYGWRQKFIVRYRAIIENSYYKSNWYTEELDLSSENDFVFRCSANTDYNSTDYKTVTCDIETDTDDTTITYTADWGDLSKIDEPTSSPRLNHKYKEPGIYKVLVTVKSDTDSTKYLAHYVAVRSDFKLDYYTSGHFTKCKDAYYRDQKWTLLGNLEYQEKYKSHAIRTEEVYKERIQDGIFSTSGFENSTGFGYYRHKKGSCSGVSSEPSHKVNLRMYICLKDYEKYLTPKSESKGKVKYTVNPISTYSACYEVEGHFHNASVVEPFTPFKKN